jgi:hypothetical protein
VLNTEIGYENGKLIQIGQHHVQLSVCISIREYLGSGAKEFVSLWPL